MADFQVRFSELILVRRMKRTLLVNLLKDDVRLKELLRKSGRSWGKIGRMWRK
jgi:hypothetical protein